MYLLCIEYALPLERRRRRLGVYESIERATEERVKFRKALPDMLESFEWEISKKSINEEITWPK